jgi:hypothetical protein
MEKQIGNAGPVFLVWVVLFAVIQYGWVRNIITIIGSDFSHITGMLVARVIGVFVAPLGVVLGYF